MFTCFGRRKSFLGEWFRRAEESQKIKSRRPLATGPPTIKVFLRLGAVNHLPATGLSKQWVFKGFGRRK
jgi:hypothetical protein